MTVSSEQKMPEGYKQTDIGIIPKDWSLVTYDEAFKFLRTASYPRDQLGLGNTLYVHYGDIHTKWNHFVDLNEDLPTIEDGKVNNYSLIEDGDLIVADASEDYEGVCKSVEVRNMDSKKAISGLHTFLLRDKGNYFVKGFRGYIHSNLLVKASIDRLATGLKVYGVSKSNLKLIQIPQPSLPEQELITSALLDVDSLIRKIQTLIEKKTNIKQGAMQELLTGKRRLIGHKGKWEEKALGKIAAIVSGGTPSTFVKEYWDGDIFWCTPTDITSTKGKYISETERTISEKGLKNSSANLLPKGTLLLCSRATIGEVKIATVPICTNQGFKSLICNPDVNNEFIYYKLLNIKKKLIEKAIGSTFLEISKKEISSIKLIMPEEIKEQIAIGNVLSDMDSEIEKLESQLAKYKNIKQGMMQNLLTGKIRLNKKLWTNNQ